MRRYYQITLLLAVGFLLAFGLAMPTMAQLQFHPSPTVPQTPESQQLRQEPNTAGCSCSCRPQTERLQALTPADTPALTLATRPDFFVFLPDFSKTDVLTQPESRQAEFILLNPITQTEVFAATIPITGEEGILRLSWPQNFPELAVGEQYLWLFAVWCQDDSPIEVGGFIKRIPPPDTLLTQLQTATPQQAAALYANAGIWVEALSAMAQAIQAQPDDAELLADWHSLLASVELEGIATKSWLSPQPLLVEQAKTSALFPIVSDGKAGFINVVGEVVISPQFEAVKPFSELGELPNGQQLAPVQINGRWGYINTTGAIAIEPQFDNVGLFFEGLAVVAQNGKTGYIDATGTVVIPIELTPAFWAILENFSEGLVVVSREDGFYYMNSQGEIAIPTPFEFAGPFSEGLAWVIVDDKVSYIDRSGQFVIPPQFDIGFFLPAGLFSEGLAWVIVDNKLGYIDRSGQFAIPPQFEPVATSDFSEGLANVVLEMGSLQGYIDKTGTQVIEPQFFVAGSFQEGLAPVFIVESNSIPGQGAYITPAGEVAIRVEANHLGDFNHGLAWIEGKESGYIDRTGRFVWQPGD